MTQHNIKKLEQERDKMQTHLRVRTPFGRADGADGAGQQRPHGEGWDGDLKDAAEGRRARQLEDDGGCEEGQGCAAERLTAAGGGVASKSAGCLRGASAGVDGLLCAPSPDAEAENDTARHLLQTILAELNKSFSFMLGPDVAPPPARLRVAGRSRRPTDAAAACVGSRRHRSLDGVDV